jgi:hypothetical protein
MSTLFRSKVAVKAGDPQLPGVLLVREGNGLDGLVILLIPGPVEASQPGRQE